MRKRLQASNEYVLSGIKWLKFSTGVLYFCSPCLLKLRCLVRQHEQHCNFPSSGLGVWLCSDMNIPEVFCQDIIQFKPIYIQGRSYPGLTIVFLPSICSLSWDYMTVRYITDFRASSQLVQSCYNKLLLKDSVLVSCCTTSEVTLSQLCTEIQYSPCAVTPLLLTVQINSQKSSPDVLFYSFGLEEHVVPFLFVNML